MQDYLIMKEDFKFKKILSGGYDLTENSPVVLKKKTMGDGSIKVVYAQYTTTTIKIKFGNMSGNEVLEYYNKLTNGVYEFWSKLTKTYIKANFIVTKPSIKMICSKNGEIWDDFTITLEKSSEYIDKSKYVTNWKEIDALGLTFIEMDSNQKTWHDLNEGNYLK